MKKILILSLSVFLLAFTVTSRAQEYRGKEAASRVPGSEFIMYADGNQNPDFLKLSTGNEVDLSKMDQWLRNIYHLEAGASWQLIGTEKDQLGQVHYRYQQTWNHLPVRDGIFIVHTYNGKIFSVNGRIYSAVNVLNSSSLGESSALNQALSFVHALKYKWEIPAEEILLKEITGKEDATYFPAGEKVLVKDNNNDYRQAWKFNIYASEPLSRQEIFVDAQTGKVLLVLDKIQTTDAPGTAVTRYSGTRAITSDSTAPANFRLRETGRGNGIQTYNMLKGTTYGNAVDFTDADNYWNNANPDQDEIAGDAHWGAEMTYDYFWTQHNRNSIDANGFALISYVHYDNSYNNAFWDGTEMTYGDGDGTNYNPFTALDICGHEITHGLESFTSNFDYANESGALSEGYSDVFGTCIEFYGKPSTANWNCGEDIGQVLRSLSDPNTTQNPDTYLGTYWDPGQEVHQNSTVLSHWFYRLSQGGSGTNDNGNAFSVVAQGMTKAAAIAFRTLTVYLINSSGYSDARFYSIVAAGDLYGGCSAEAESTADAWYAVGVGSVYVPTVVPDFTSNFTSLCSAPASIQFTNTTMNANTYKWYFGDGATSTQTSPAHTYAATGNYNVKLVAYGGACGNDSITKNSYISINSGNTAVVSMPSSGTGTLQNCCLGKLYDSGGAQDYANNTSSQITLSPPGAMSVTLNFASFSMEAGYDYLYIYDGPNTSSTLIGQYDGTTLPNGGIITSTTGSITLRQETDQGVVASGYEINWHCNYPNAAPTPNFTADVTQTCTGIIQFTDLSTNGPSSWSWDFGDGSSSTAQHPLHAYTQSGTYTVILVAGNGFGNNSVTKTNYIIVNLPSAPTVISDTICDNTTASLSATGSGTLIWFDVPIGGSPLDTGSSFTTPVLFTNTTFYVENQIIGSSSYGGKTDNSGNGGFFSNSNEHGLYFNCTQACNLASVKVYAQGAAPRTITLLDNTGSTILSGTFNIPDGQSRVNLNWNIPVGSGMRLMGPGTPNLYRNGTQSGPNLGYPFNVGGKLSIYQSTAGSPNTMAYYYYFYDWEIKDPTCISARIPVEVNVLNCSGTEEIEGFANVNVTPNPANDHLNIRFIANESGIANIVLFDVLGRPVIQQNFEHISGQNSDNIDISKLSAGVYLLQLANTKGSTIMRIVIE